MTMEALDLCKLYLIYINEHLESSYCTIGAELELYLEDKYIVDLKQEMRYGYFLKEEDGYQQYEIVTPIYRTIEPFLYDLAYHRHLIQGYSSEALRAKQTRKSPGSALHFNMGFNCPEMVFQAIGGLCQTMVGYMTYFAQDGNSYERYKNPDINTPTTVSWGWRDNRTVAVRYCQHQGRVEHRVSCSDSDPLLSLTAVLAGVVYGIDKKVHPAKPTYGVASDHQYNLGKFPTSYKEACILKKDLYTPQCILMENLSDLDKKITHC